MSDDVRLDCIHSYDPKRQRWEDRWGVAKAKLGAGAALGVPSLACDRLPRGARFAVGAAVAGNRMHVVGGYNGRALDLVETLDLDAAEWLAQPPCLNVARTDFAIAACEQGAVDACVVVAGGGTDSTELLLPHTQLWAPGPPLPGGVRSSCRAGAVGGKVFILGGFDSKEAILDSVVELDLAATLCLAVRPMQTARMACGVSVLGGRVCAAGGYNHADGHLRSVEFLDPRVGRWERGGKMAVRRYDLAVAVLCDCLYAAGGCDEDDHCTAVVEVYEPRMDRWQLCPRMLSARQYFGLVGWSG